MNPRDCRECASQNHCNKQICVGFPDTSYAQTFDSVCQLMQELSKRKGLLTIFIGLGDCSSLLNPTGWGFITRIQSKSLSQKHGLVNLG